MVWEALASYMYPSGVIKKACHILPNSRKTIRLNNQTMLKCGRELQVHPSILTTLSVFPMSSPPYQKTKQPDSQLMASYFNLTFSNFQQLFCLICSRYLLDLSDGDYLRLRYHDSHRSKLFLPRTNSHTRPHMGSKVRWSPYLILKNYSILHSFAENGLLAF